MNTYWNSNGKYQDWVDKTSETMPDMYYTDNKFMNIFIAMNKVYYDIYNNGGGNLLDGCHKEALEFVLDDVKHGIEILLGEVNECARK